MPLIGVVELKKSIKTLSKKKDKALKELWESTIFNIMSQTPVDRGVTRANWIHTQGAASTDIIKYDRKVTGVAPPDIKQFSGKMFGKKHFFTNNTPQAPMLEFGTYPYPDSKKLVSGFSRMRPEGWVRTNLIKLRQEVKKL